MKLLALALLTTAATLFALATAPPAECEWCGTLMCWTSNDCPGSCLCARAPLETSGTCVNVR